MFRLPPPAACATRRRRRHSSRPAGVARSRRLPARAPVGRRPDAAALVVERAPRRRAPRRRRTRAPAYSPVARAVATRPGIAIHVAPAAPVGHVIDRDAARSTCRRARVARRAASRLPPVARSRPLLYVTSRPCRHSRHRRHRSASRCSPTSHPPRSSPPRPLRSPPPCPGSSPPLPPLPPLAVP